MAEHTRGWQLSSRGCSVSHSHQVSKKESTDAGKLRLMGTTMGRRPGVWHSRWEGGGKQHLGVQAS